MYAKPTRSESGTAFAGSMVSFTGLSNLSPSGSSCTVATAPPFSSGIPSTRDTGIIVIFSRWCSAPFGISSWKYEPSLPVAETEPPCSPITSLDAFALSKASRTFTGVLSRSSHSTPVFAVPFAVARSAQPAPAAATKIVAAARMKVRMMSRLAGLLLHQLDAPILLPPFSRRVRRGRLARAQALRRQPLRAHALAHEIRLHRVGALGGEGEVRLRVTDVVGVALDGEREIGMLGEHRRDLLQRRRGLAADVVGARIEENAMRRDAARCGKGVVELLPAGGDANGA